jgi:hypothetical protein
VARNRFSRPSPRLLVLPALVGLVLAAAAFSSAASAPAQAPRALSKHADSCTDLAKAKAQRNTYARQLKATSNQAAKARLRQKIKLLDAKIAKLKKLCNATPPPAPGTTPLKGKATCKVSGPRVKGPLSQAQDYEDECDEEDVDYSTKSPKRVGSGAFDSMKVVVTGPVVLQITNKLCPTQLPNPTVTTTTRPNDTLLCSGGSLPAKTPFKFNLRFDKNPEGDSVQIYLTQSGKLYGPLTAALH